MWPILFIYIIVFVFVGERLYHLVKGLASDEEFAILADFLGGESVAGGKMKEAGLELDIDKSYDKGMSIYESEGWEHQLVFNKFLMDEIGYVDNKFLAAAIVAYRRGKEANLKAYPNVHRTLNHLMKIGIRLAIVSDAPSREAWMRIYYLNLHHMFDAVVTFDDSKERKPSPLTKIV